MNESSQIQQIRERRAAVQDIEITDDTPERGQHCGYVLGVGNNQLGPLWHCSDDRTHPDHAAVVAAGGDLADLYCNSHYASVADEAVFEFFLKAKEDVQVLLDEIDRTPAQTFQARTYEWILACFGPEEAADTVERHHRFLEEALELVQATGCTESEAAELVAYVYGRPVGQAHQEVGGVMLTLAALCSSHGLEMQVEGETELARVWTKTEQIRAKQAAKPKHSPLPGVSEGFARPPRVVCLCGPTRYREAYAEANAWFTLGGYVVLSCGVFKGDPWYHQTPKVALDELHLRKIDMAEIAVFIGGEAAAGESTRAELAYAWKHGKQVIEWKLDGSGLRGMNRPDEWC